MIINFKLDKIIATKQKLPKGNIEASNNVKVIDVEKESVASLSDQKAVTFKFMYGVTYKPNIASIELDGNVVYMSDDATVKGILDNWKKNKKIEQGIAAQVFNAILSRCNIKALKLEEELELPFHIPVPRVRTKEQTAPETKQAKAS